VLNFVHCIAVVAHLVTRSWLMSILNTLLLIDTVGTAAVLFDVTRQFEAAVLTTGKDISALMRV
jgi:hypothetical protein